MQDLQALAEEIVRKAKKRCVDFADCVISESADFSVVYRMGKVDKLTEATSRALGLRLIQGGKTAITYTSDFAPDRLDAFVAGGVELLAYASPDETSPIPDPDAGGLAEGDLKLCDPAIEALTAEKKIELARQTEEAMFAADKRVTNTEGSEYSTNLTAFVLANSHGFAGEYRRTAASISASAVLDDTAAAGGENVKGKKQTDFWYSIGTSLSALDSPGSVGTKAAQRAVRLIGSRKMETQEAAVVFEQMAASGFLRNIYQAISGASVWRKQSFLVDALGQRIGSPLFTIIDDPLIPSHLGSRPFDGEGVRVRRTVVFDEGKLTNYLLDTYSARKLGMKTTGNAGRGVSSRPTVGPSNFYLQAGTDTPEEIIGSVKNGLLVIHTMGFGVNLVNGTYSQGVQGIWIRDGKLEHPVSEMTVAGNLRDMLAAIDKVGNDLVFRGSVAAPTFRIAKATLSGM